jgi:nucleoside-diphosphate-sugar epimerase
MIAAMKIAIWGAAGTIGRSVVAALSKGDDEVRVVGRSRARLEEAFGHVPGLEIISADLSEPEGCARAAAGVDAIIYTLGLPYSREAFSEYPEMMQHTIAAARSAGVARLVHISNVYPYGRPRTERVAEDHPREPVSVKGRYRKEQEDVVLGAHEPGTLATLVLRLPNFYGPHAELSVSQEIFTAAVAGKTANVLGPADTPQEFVFTPDVGLVVAALLGREDAFGTAYNLAGPDTITMRELAHRIFAAAGHKPSLRIAGPRMQRFLGLFMPIMRELAEMSYLLTSPVLLDDSKLKTLLGPIHKTPYDQGIARTIAHLRGDSAA